MDNVKKTSHPNQFWEFFTETFSNKFHKNSHSTKLNKLNCYYSLNLILNKRALFNSLRLKPFHLNKTHDSFNLNYLFRKKSHLNLNFKFKNNIHSIDHLHITERIGNENNIVNYKSNSTMLKNFSSFLLINSEVTQSNLMPNASSQAFYFSNSKGGSKILNISKLFKKWLDFYNLMFNVFYYKIKILNFAPASHKKEAISLSWEDFTQSEKLWRYTKPFLFNKPNTINDEGDFTFYKLRLKGWAFSIISDISYHSKTLIYLRRAGFFTVTSLPSIYDGSLVDFFLPSNADTSLTLSYFLRTVMGIKNDANYEYVSFLSFERW